MTSLPKTSEGSNKRKARQGGEQGKPRLWSFNSLDRGSSMRNTETPRKPKKVRCSFWRNRKDGGSRGVWCALTAKSSARTYSKGRIRYRRAKEHGSKRECIDEGKKTGDYWRCRGNLLGPNNKVTLDPRKRLKLREMDCLCLGGGWINPGGTWGKSQAGFAPQ